MPARRDMTPEQEARLPKAAQRELDRLRRELREAGSEIEKLCRQVALDPEGSNTFVEGYDIRPDLPLGDSPLIRFGTTRADHAITVRLTKKGEIYVAGVWDELAVSPRASNVVTIRAGRT